MEENQKDIAWIFGTKSGRNVNKFRLAKVKTVPAKKIRPPLIECPVAFECKVEFMKEFGDHYWVVGKVLEVHIWKEKFKPLLHYSGNIFPKVESL